MYFLAFHSYQPPGRSPASRERPGGIVAIARQHEARSFRKKGNLYDFGLRSSARQNNKGFGMVQTTASLR